MNGSGATADGLEVLNEERSGEAGSPGHFAQTLRLPADLPCLEGHFPGLPVLPGLVQLEWAVGAAETLCGGPVRLLRIEALKFRELLRPGDTFVARARASAEGDRVDFEAARDEHVVASGRLRLASPADPPTETLGAAPSFVPSGEALAASELVPHAGPMVFLDRLLVGDEKQTVCSVRIDDLPFFRSESGVLPVWAGLEPMAQCIAAHGGLDARRRGERPRIGFLLGCRRLEMQGAGLEPGVGYAVSAVQVWGGEQGLVSFDCDLFEERGGRRLLAGRINAYLPENLDDVLEGTLGG